MTPGRDAREPEVDAVADALRRRPTVRLGDGVDPTWRDALDGWAREHGMELTERDATLAVTTDPGQADGAAWVHSPFAGVEHLAPALPDGVLPLADTFDAEAFSGGNLDAAPFDPTRIDVLLLALPHIPATDGLVTPGLLRAFDGVHLVNIGRGSAVRTGTLLDALDDGTVRHATLDVVEREPLEASSPLWRRSDVTVTPHVSGLTLASDVVDALDAALTAIRAGARPASAVAREQGY